MKSNTLVIVPCGRKKIWDKSPKAGPTAAQQAYTSTPFSINKQYAEKHGTRWVILSAKYGFIDPRETIPGPYNVTFKSKLTGPISVRRLQEQIREMNLNSHSLVIGLGGKEYRQAIEAAFDKSPIDVAFPFAGLPIGKMMQAIKRAT